MEQLKSREGISKKGLFILWTLGLAAIIAVSLPKKINVTVIGNLYTGRENK